MLVKACVCAQSNLQRRFHLQGGAVKYVQSCLSASKDGESIFHYCRSPVYGRETPYHAAKEVL